MEQGQNSQRSEEKSIQSGKSAGSRANRNARAKKGKRNGSKSDESRDRPRYMSEVCMDDGSRHGEYSGHGQRAGKGFLNRQFQEPDISGREQKSAGIGEQSRD